MSKSDPNQLTLLEYLEETEVALPSAAPLSLREREVWLEQETKRSVKLTFTRNRRQMLSWKPEAGQLKVRAHEMFRDASHEIWCALVSYFLDGDRLCGQVVDQFIERELRHWSQENARQEPIRSVGKYHHLGELFDELNSEFFHQACVSQITWGRAGKAQRRVRKSIQLGVYDPELKVIRIHPSLDQSFVPRFYVRWIIFHEMLHEILGVRSEGGRRQIHPPEFVALEESYPDYAQCMAWQRGNLKRLLSYSGKT